MKQNVRRRKVDIPRRERLERPRRPSKQKPQVGLYRETVAIILFVFGIFLLAALISYYRQKSPSVGAQLDPMGMRNAMGMIGGKVATVLAQLLGWCSFVTVIWVLTISRNMWVLIPDREDSAQGLGRLLIAVIGSILLAASSALVASVLFGFEGGGDIGALTAFYLVRYLNEPGALLVGFGIMLLSFGLATGIGVKGLMLGLRYFIVFIVQSLFDAGYFVWTTSSLVWSGKISPARLLTRLGGFLAGGVGALLLSIPSLPRRLVNFLLRRSTPAEEREWEIGEEPPKERAEDPFVMGRGKERDYVLEDSRDVLISRRSSGIPEERRKRRDARSKKKLKELLAGRKGKKKAVEEKPEKSTAKKKDFQNPPMELLAPGEQVASAPRDDLLIANSRLLERTLSDFKIGGKVVQVHPGPIITLYEFEPAAGMKVQRIVNLADDMALALKVASVRIYAPVPGKGTVGIEVPNADREIVRLRDVLDSGEFKNTDSALNLAIGKDTFGDPFVADLSKMPHLLIAGATGTGKSVCINALLLSLLYRNPPSELRFIMIDPKMLELSIYEEIPHLKAPVVTNPKRARGVLWWAVEEMERRYRLMRELGVRHLANYNRVVSSKGFRELKSGTVLRDGKIVDADSELQPNNSTESVNGTTFTDPLDVLTPNVSAPKDLAAAVEVEEDIIVDRKRIKSQHEALPRIVIVVDELADLMLTVGREIEELLTRLAQKARAAGIHLILATQRPSVNVITGLIKANFPARISFQVASRIDARTVMDTSGAEKLLGQGDMLFLAQGAGRVRRLHSAYVSDKEVQDVVEWLRAQGAPDYDTNIEAMIQRLDENENNQGMDGGGGEEDPLYDQAVRLVIDKGQASTSMVQRVFRIGYNRAARILETMERQGVVGPADGAKPRSVLVPNREALG